MDIIIDIVDKKAMPRGEPIIVCGNSDYVLSFSFDEEWLPYESKTARVSYISRGKLKFFDLVFNGTRCELPILSQITAIKVGVYAGNLRTTTPAHIDCSRSILCDGGEPEAPSPSVYGQILEMLNETEVAAKEAMQEVELDRQEIAKNKRVVEERTREVAQFADDAEASEGVAREQAELAAKSADDAAKSAKDAAESAEVAADEVRKAVDEAQTEALTAVNEAKVVAIGVIEEEKNTAINAVETAKNGALDEVNDIKEQAVSDVNSIKADAIDGVEVVKSEAVEAVTEQKEISVAEVKAETDNAKNEALEEIDLKMNSYPFAPLILNEKRGAIIAVNDSANEPLSNLKLYGKSESGSENVEIDIYGKNLWTLGNQTFTQYKAINLERPIPIGTYTVSAVIDSEATHTTLALMSLRLANGTSVSLYFDGRNKRIYKNATVNSPVISVYLYSADNYNGSTGCICTWSDIQIEFGSIMTDFEVGKPVQTMTLTRPLRRVGEVCDEVDFARGVYIQRCGLDAPIEIPLEAEEINAFKALHMNYPNTTILSGESLEMSVEYGADTKIYIDNKFTELQNAILSAGANV